MAEQKTGNTTAPVGANANASAPVRTPVVNANATQPPLSNLDANATKTAPATNTTIGVSPARGESNKTEAKSPEAGGLGGTIVWLLVLTAVFILVWYAGWIHRLRVFAEETQEQLRKCTWPTTHELAQHVVVVLLGTLMLAIFTMGSEFVARKLVWSVLLGTEPLFSKN